MHPVDYLFEDIYRNYWGIGQAGARQQPKRVRPSAWSRDAADMSVRKR